MNLEEYKKLVAELAKELNYRVVKKKRNRHYLGLVHTTQNLLDAWNFSKKLSFDVDFALSSLVKKEENLDLITLGTQVVVVPQMNGDYSISVSYNKKR